MQLNNSPASSGLSEIGDVVDVVALLLHDARLVAVFKHRVHPYC